MIVGDEPGEILTWIAAATLLLPMHLAVGVSFKVLAVNVDYLDHRIVGVSSELRPGVVPGSQGSKSFSTRDQVLATTIQRVRGPSIGLSSGGKSGATPMTLWTRSSWNRFFPPTNGLVKAMFGRWLGRSRHPAISTPIRRRLYGGRRVLTDLWLRSTEHHYCVD